MSDIAALKMNVETDGLTHAADEMERLAVASERVAAALVALNGQPHGGIRFQSVGAVTEMTVSPYTDMSGLPPERRM